MVWMHCSKHTIKFKLTCWTLAKAQPDSNAQSADTSHKAAACALKLQALRRTNMASTASMLVGMCNGCRLAAVWFRF